QLVPQCGFLGGLDLRQIEGDRGPGVTQGPVVVDGVEHEVDDRGGKAGAVRLAHVAVVEVEAAGAEDPGREVELAAPGGDEAPSEKTLGPAVHLRGDMLGDAEEDRVPGDREAEIPLVGERPG